MRLVLAEFGVVLFPVLLDSSTACTLSWRCVASCHTIAVICRGSVAVRVSSAANMVLRSAIPSSVVVASSSSDEGGFFCMVGVSASSELVAIVLAARLWVVQC